jgi:hypothetical protein
MKTRFQLQKITCAQQEPIKADLSSIKSNTLRENSRFEEELDSVIDLESLRMYDYLAARDPARFFSIQYTGETFIRDMLKYALTLIVQGNCSGRSQRYHSRMRCFEKSLSLQRRTQST